MTARRTLAIALSASIALAGIVAASTISAASEAAPAAKLQPRAISNTMAWAAVKTISLGGASAIDIAVNGSDDTVYVVNGSSSNSLSVINGSRGFLDSSYALPGNGLAVAVDQNDDTIYTVTTGQVQSRSASSPNLVATTVSGADAYNVAVNTLDDTVYVARSVGANITYFSGRAPGAGLTVNVGGSGTYGIAVDQQDDSVFLSYSVDGWLRALAGATNTVGSVIGGMGDSPLAVAVNGPDDTVYVANSGINSNTVQVVNGRSSVVGTPITLPGRVETSGGMAVDDSTDRLFVTMPSQPAPFGVINEANADDSVYLRSRAFGSSGISIFPRTVAVDDSGPNQGLVWGASGTGWVQAFAQVSPRIQAPATGAAGATVTFTVTPTSVVLPFAVATDTVWGVSFNGGTPVTNLTNVDDTTWSVPLPSGLPGGQVPVEVWLNGDQYALAGTFTVQSPNPPAPTPVYPPGAPTDVKAVAGSGEATVSWTAPTDIGSYPITDYEVTSSPGSHTCLSKTTSCTVTGLEGGTSYTFTVRALNGAGWGVYSTPSNAVTPTARTILITGSRDATDDRYVKVRGTTTDLAGKQVAPYVRFPGESGATAGTGVRTVSADGTFTWQRKTGKKVYVYFKHAGVRSNTVTIAAR